uniref:Serine carboxypeptidase n=1 Tax=Ditylenchus dipsaci TaxID=166011 RepID=A0A915ELM7_9BILA
MAVGNPLLSQTHLLNSIIGVKYHHGFIDKSQWDSLRTCCPDIAAYQDLARCDFSKFINLESSSYGHLVPVNDSVCATTIAAIATPFENTNNNFNIYQDCYETLTQIYLLKRQKKEMLETIPKSLNVSTTENYLNNQDVRAALHIPSYVQDFAMCRIEIESHYTTEITDMSPIFDAIIASGYQLKMLIYSGDVDFVCNPIGTQWFVEEVVDRNGLNVQDSHAEWLYRQQIGVIANCFKAMQHLYTCSLLRPLRPKDKNQREHKKTAFKDTASDSKVNLLKAPPTQTKEQDLITELPGLTFSMPPQYSGYLNATKGPLILWLNGGPAFSRRHSTCGNVFGWTKVGHVLYLETPRGVGFSYSTDESDIPATNLQ